MTEERWALVIWWSGMLLLVPAAILTLGLLWFLVQAWWIGGPYYIDEHNEMGPDWGPVGAEKSRARIIR